MKAWMAAALIGAMTTSGVTPLALAAPQPGTGHELYQNCKESITASGRNTIPSGTDMLSVGLCLGLIEGVKKTIAILQTGMSARETQVCWPESGLTNGQGALIAINYLDRNPARLNEDQTTVVILAFKDAFPCKG
ncbi:hypothetical protein PS943_05512 [Pseudomonas fluorescens]|jgi:hypothetical protein|uniref:Rap1a immunity protein domain-containing protein n=1 Tax=Pseudomonas fluorescens TaxID=294 RepID=A0A5E7WS62_PSEFL|nr:Rap1a/Tai family immunity protein [Pseudomonas fluorescens]VVQ37932.1 hypothetical protein PS943_05512 [Pseudomonas fluorescens]